MCLLLQRWFCLYVRFRSRRFKFCEDRDVSNLKINQPNLMLRKQLFHHVSISQEFVQCDKNENVFLERNK